MKWMGVNDIRESFLSFFESKEHLRLPSFSLVPRNDKSLLLINAGMAPLKPYFTGQEVPPKKRVVTCQKCIRTGDIERVGRTSRHATFFEMLGNFSFGDYFKNEIIPWAWEYITEVLQIPKDKLYVTIYLDDDEAFDIWVKKTDVNPSHIFRLGKDDNFWEIGQGPCGPCSEIHFNKTDIEVKDVDMFVKMSDEDKVIEFWNLVFTQFDKDENGNYNRLKNPNIDTGMGLERMATIMQHVESIFEIDTMKKILNKVEGAAKTEYGKDKNKDVSLRVITDHLRGVTIMVSDGILPSNEGRGYVLRRLLRRAARHGKLLGIEGSFLFELCDTVIENSREAYPELEQKKDFIKKVIRLEEEKFDETIDQGMNILNQFIEELIEEKKNILPGDKAFKLYDTYGFPVELTLEILEEKEMNIDLKGFNSEMEAQKERARSARGETNYMGADLDIYSTLPKEITTEFTGYETLEDNVKINLLIKDDSIADRASLGDVVVILDKTPFYAEMGGQVGDKGTIFGENLLIEILDCKKTNNGKIIHIGRIVKGEAVTGSIVTAKVDASRRADIARNHTATHLLHGALRMVLGSHVEQSGSLVADNRLRFDFTHFEAIGEDDLLKIEKIVNEKVLEELNVKTDEMTLDEAKKLGAIALFGEKYSNNVRVVRAEDFSMELCGGTHVRNTSSIGLFKILSEGGVAAGVRRIEAVTGRAALGYVEELEKTVKDASKVLKTGVKEIVKRAEAINLELKEKDREIDELKGKMSKNAAEELLSSAAEIKGVKVVTGKIDMDMDSLRDLGDRLRDKLGKSLIVLGSTRDGKVNFVVMASKDAVASGIHAGNLVREIAKIAGGGGGGRPDVAQAGGKLPEKVDEALKAALKIAETMIK